MTYDNKTLEPILPILADDEKEHVIVPHDECLFSANNQHRHLWLAGDQQPLRKKGNGHSVHVSDFILEPCGCLALNAEEIAMQEKLPAHLHLKTYDARKIIYPGKNHDKWWDISQLQDQLRGAIDIFEFKLPNKTGVFVFDCSAAHESFAADALNVNNMNVKPGDKQAHLHDTVIPLKNPAPQSGQPDTRGQPQSLIYPLNHPEYPGQPKGMRAVLQEWTSVWEKLCKEASGEKKVIGMCKVCKMSEKKKDALRHLALAEMAGQEDTVDDVLLQQLDETRDVEDSLNEWCCMTRVLALQDDFVSEKPLIQTYIESRSHMCLFLPKFHCEFNPIELLWGYAKYRASFIDCDTVVT
ncbi:unnamed protein product [Somion occarium]|uniref:Uncharacterized protein n=1 Tax=Somion occarium TaxID=3059160 RepID=A0ABP1DDV0_9APHY